MAVMLGAILVVQWVEWKADCSADESVERMVEMMVEQSVGLMVVSKVGN